MKANNVFVASLWYNSKGEQQGYVLIDVCHEGISVRLSSFDEAEQIMRRFGTVHIRNAIWDVKYRVFSGRDGEVLTKSYPKVVANRETRNITLQSRDKITAVGRLFDESTKKLVGLAVVNALGARHYVYLNKLYDLISKKKVEPTNFTLARTSGSDFDVKIRGTILSGLDTLVTTKKQHESMVVNSKIDDKATIEAKKERAKTLEAQLKKNDVPKIEAVEITRDSIDEDALVSAQGKMATAKKVMSMIAPYYYCCLETIPQHIDKRPGSTMSVTPNRMYYNLEFVASKSVPELVFVLIHEIMHICMQHSIRGRGKNHELYNIAADLYINSLIARDYKLVENSGKTVYKAGGSGALEYAIELPKDGLCLQQYGLTLDIARDTAESIYYELLEENEQSPFGNNQSNNNDNDTFGAEDEVPPRDTEDNQNNSNKPDEIDENNNSSESQDNNNESNDNSNTDSDNSQSNDSSGDSSEEGESGSQGDSSGDESEGEDSSNGDGSQGSSSENGSGSGNSLGEGDDSQSGFGGSNSGSSGSNSGSSGSKQSGGSSQSDSFDGNLDVNSQKIDGSDMEGGSGSSLDVSDINTVVIDREVTLRGKKIKCTIRNDFQTDRDLSNDEEYDKAVREGKDAISKMKAKVEKEETVRGISLSEGGDGFSADGAGLSKRFITYNLASKVDWKTILKNCMQVQRKKLYSLSRPARNRIGIGMIAPSPVQVNGLDKVKDLKICVDVSGSVSDEVLNKYLGVVANLLSKYEVNAELIYWSTKVGDAGEFSEVKDLMKVNPNTTGGTDVSCLFRYLCGQEKSVTNKTEPTRVKDITSVIIITDGDFGRNYGEYEKHFGKKTIWMIDGDPVLFNPMFGSRVVGLDLRD